MKPHVYHVGDKVRILRPRLIRRVGYPLHFMELREEAANILRELDLTNLGFRQANYSGGNFRDLVYGLAKSLVLDRGYGGNERSIHYFPIGKPIPEGELWAFDLLAISDDDDYSIQPKPDPTGHVTTVNGKYVRKTGIRYGQSGGYNGWGEYDYEPGGLENEKTHIILKTRFGDIETCDVELVEAVQETNYELT